MLWPFTSAVADITSITNLLYELHISISNSLLSGVRIRMPHTCRTWYWFIRVIYKSPTFLLNSNWKTFLLKGSLLEDFNYRNPICLRSYAQLVGDDRVYFQWKFEIFFYLSLSSVLPKGRLLCCRRDTSHWVNFPQRFTFQ